MNGTQGNPIDPKIFRCLHGQLSTRAYFVLNVTRMAGVSLRKRPVKAGEGSGNTHCLDLYFLAFICVGFRTRSFRSGRIA
jgi:hypothetical protein